MFEGAMSGCVLCPRRCGVNRASGKRGYCGAGDSLEIYTWQSHPGEEPPISGTRGSGTVFFSRCPLRCLYCQNYKFSQEGEGRVYDTDGLKAMLVSLRDIGCHNWNFVSPTPWLPFIARAVDELRKDGISVPVVYNTSGYENVETVEDLSGLVDVYLTDLRYAVRETAESASAARDYTDTARQALRAMWRTAGPLKTDSEGVALSGTICRILILPGKAGEAVENLRWMAREFGTGMAVSVMAQYTPAHRGLEIAPWNRRVTLDEYEAVRDVVEELEFDCGWMQDYCGETDSSLVGYNLRPPAADVDHACNDGVKKNERS